MQEPTNDIRATGTLTVVVHTAGNALPVPGAQVTVTAAEEEGGGLMRAVLTEFRLLLKPMTDLCVI